MEHLFVAMGGWPMVGTQKVAVRHVRGTINAPSKVMRRFESSRSGAVRTLGATLSHISSPEVSACSAESVDEEACCARAITLVSINSCWTFSLEWEV